MKGEHDRDRHCTYTHICIHVYIMYNIHIWEYAYVYKYDMVFMIGYDNICVYTMHRQRNT